MDAPKLCSPVLQGRGSSGRAGHTCRLVAGVQHQATWSGLKEKRRMHQCKVGFNMDTSRVLVRDAGAHLVYSTKYLRRAPLHIMNHRPNPYCSLYPLLHFPDLLTTEHLQSHIITCPGLLFSPRISRLLFSPAAARNSTDMRTAFAVCAKQCSKWQVPNRELCLSAIHMVQRKGLGNATAVVYAWHPHGCEYWPRHGSEPKK